ncbi:MAG: sensor histidine kinase [Chloroflexi bacterium]|nr:sensor histidine kinase [Chloroflexota bacterium]
MSDQAKRFDGLHEEAKTAIGYSAKVTRSVRDRYRAAYADALDQWQALREESDAAWDGAEDRSSRRDVEAMAVELGLNQGELARLELAEQTLARTWLFLERGDATLVTEIDGPTAASQQMRIVEAQEAERSRLAQEIHDGPAQAISNASFQVEYIERVIETDPSLARTELRYLRELLRRDMGDIRAFISQLRPPLLDQLGLSGAITDAVERMRTLTDLTISTDLAAADTDLSDSQRTVALRITQEALQNVRKHAAASTVEVMTGFSEDGWVLQIRDDGRGFDIGTVAARGRRNFGLQFMRERAELVGAQFDIRSAPDGGTVVRLAIPTGIVTGGEDYS